MTIVTTQPPKNGWKIFASPIENVYVDTNLQNVHFFLSKVRVIFFGGFIGNIVCEQILLARFRKITFFETKPPVF